MAKSGHRWRTNNNYHPYESQYDIFVQCTICSQWVDDYRTEEIERFGGITLITTGETYHPTEPGVEGLATKDLQVEPRTSKYRNCWFCGGNWRTGNGPEGLRL